MSQRAYRRLTRILFLLLAALFILLYLLLQGKTGGRPGSQGGSRWVNRTLPLGDIMVSEERSSGFLVDEFPLPAPTHPEEGDFNENVITVSTSVYNEGTMTVSVTPSIYGTRHAEDATGNPGLSCGFYRYGGDTDPVGGDYATYLKSGDWTVTPHDQHALELWVKGEGVLTLTPGEKQQIILFFWVDKNAVPTLTDLERGEYSVTVKLTSRAK